MMNESILVEVLNLMVANHEDKVYGVGRYTVFNTESDDENDVRTTLYDRDGVKLLVCHDWGYFEILGIEERWFEAIVEAYKSYMKLYTYEEEKMLKEATANPFEMFDEFDEDEEYEDVTEDDYSSNCHCDTYGICGGISCPRYYQCHSK